LSALLFGFAVGVLELYSGLIVEQIETGEQGLPLHRNYLKHMLRFVQTITVEQLIAFGLIGDLAGRGLGCSRSEDNSASVTAVARGAFLGTLVALGWSVLSA
jgi:hypothetical protein